MKSKIVTTAAAALIAGVAGITAATGTSAAVINLNCSKVYGGTIFKPGYSKFSGWKKTTCLVHTVGTNHKTRPVRAVGAARFKKYHGLSATPFNLVKCMKSVVIVRLYRKVGSSWKLVQKKKVKAVPKVSYGKIIRCGANAGTKYALGSLTYKTVVMAIRGDGKVTGNTMSSLIRSHPHVI
ncbi:MAG: hypothetical protein ABFS30_09655 [Pseudomonadota bacterium]